MKKLKYLLVSSLLLLLTGCNTSTVTLDPESPSYGGGLGGNASEDDFQVTFEDHLPELLNSVKDLKKYSYEVEVNVGSTQENFTQHFAPKAWYVEYEDSQNSFGYAEEISTNYMFKYYLSKDENNAYPSIYEYSGYDELRPVEGLYSAATIANINILNNVLNKLEYVQTGINTYIITDSSVMSVFQYMSTYGSSIASYIQTFTIEIVSLDDLIFNTTLDLGGYGSITGTFSALNETKIDFVSEEAKNGTLKGVASYSNIQSALNQFNSNNFTIHGLTITNPNNQVENRNATIYCTNDYFLYDYSSENNASGWNDFGFAFVKRNKPVQIEAKNQDGTYENSRVSTLDYDAAYEFEIDPDGNYHFVNIIGPLESETTDYMCVEELPATGETNVLYIVPDNENGGYDVYEYLETTGGEYSFAFIQDWYDSIGDFYVYNTGATFYPSATILPIFGSMLFEKDDMSLTETTSYHSTNSDIISALANGIFGWGFQPTTTWMDYILQANLDFTYDNSIVNLITLSLDVFATVNGVTGIHNVAYNFDNFGVTNHQNTSEFLADYI